MRALPLPAVVASLFALAVLAQTGRDISKLDPCKVLTSADVAAATNGKVSSQVGGGVGATACLWVVDAESGAGTYQLFLQTSDVIETLFKIKSPEDKGTPIQGLWTEAYLVPPGTHGDDYILTVLKKGDVAIEVHGIDKDAVTSLAKTATTRF